MKKQYTLEGNVLTLKAKKAPLLVLSVMYFFSFLFFLMPIAAIVMGSTMDKGLHVGYIIGLFIFGVLGFYMLRMSLWNTRGREVLTFNEKVIDYVADYGWFKDAKKQREITSALKFSMRRIGYEDDKKGGLVIELDEPIFCATRMPNTELEELIDKLYNLTNGGNSYS